jgi:hypothetical protein
MLTTHPLLVPRLRNSRSCTSSHPKAPLWSVTGPLYLYLSVERKENFPNNRVEVEFLLTIHILSGLLHPLAVLLPVTNNTTPHFDKDFLT